jgi:leucyl-tRNA synthetase
MELVNEAGPALEAGIRAPVQRALVRNLLLLLAPFAPYLAHELWEVLGEKSNLLRAPWPQFDPALAKEDEVEIAVQVNGKLRTRLTVAADSSEEAVRQMALADEKVRASLDGKQVVKAIVVPGKLVNIVVK